MRVQITQERESDTREELVCLREANKAEGRWLIQGNQRESEGFYKVGK